MDGATAGAWAVGMLVGIAAIVIRRARKPKPDPEAKLRELIGPQGIAERDRNRAKAEAKNNAELLDGALKAAQKLRAEGDIAGAEKLEAYAETIRARGR